MKVTGKLTKTEWLLLALGAAFLTVLVFAYVKMSKTAEGDGYTITTQRQLPETAPEEETEEPLLDEPEESGPVDINTASQEELETLSGVGPVLAQRIIEYREANGPFQSLEELLEVKGIGEKTLEKFREDITLGEVEPPQSEDQGEEDAAA